MSWARADRLGAVLEDLGYGNAMYWSGPEAPIHALWTAITMPALVLRAAGDLAGVRVHPADRGGGAVRGGGADGTRRSVPVSGIPRLPGGACWVSGTRQRFLARCCR